MPAGKSLAWRSATVSSDRWHTEAYNTLQEKPIVHEARRDVVMVDKRYFITRDRVRLSEPKPVSLLLHAESPFVCKSGLATVQQPKAGCAVALVSPGEPWAVTVTDQFPTPVEENTAEAARTNITSPPPVRSPRPSTPSIRSSGHGRALMRARRCPPDSLRRAPLVVQRPGWQNRHALARWRQSFPEITDL